MTSDCIFCKIVAGQVPCTKVYEDADTLAFMDIGPVVKGHTLVIPKSHHERIVDTPPDVLRRLIVVVKRIAKAQIAGLAADGVNVSQANGKTAGQIVPHIHFHVIPRFETDGHRWNWTPKQYDTPAEMAGLADRISASIGQTSAE
jgi:histidine triad (HIT) family protein